MFGAFSFNNNVRTELDAGILAADTSVALVEAVSPFKDPPTDASADKPAYFTLVDNLAAPTKIEVIAATGVAAPAAGVVALTGVTRGLDGTTAQDWDGGTIVVQAMTKAMLNPVDYFRLTPDDAFSGVFAGNSASWNWTMYMNAGVGGHVYMGPETGNFYLKATGIEAGRLALTSTLSVAGATTMSGDPVTFAPANGNAFFSGGVATFFGSLVASKAAPANSSATGVAKEIRFDTNYIYICVGTNNWKRVALSAF